MPQPAEISVNIPTKNSGSTLERCLAAVRDQRVRSEIIIADDCSTDDTHEIASRFGATILPGPLPLLEARYQAARRSSADVVVLLDSDQFLEPQILDQCLTMMEYHDALVLEERAAHSTTWLSKLFEADRRLVHSLADHHLDPTKGALLPRVFHRSLLLLAFDEIPEKVRRIAVAQDHAILYRAASRSIASVGLVRYAVEHEEMSRLREMWRKYYRWGDGLAELFTVCPECRELTKSNVRGRLYRGNGSSADYARSLVLLGLKAIPYSLGYAHGRLRLTLAS